MKHYIYTSSGNTLGIEEYIGFFEIGDDDYCRRYLEIRPTGEALKYTETHDSDSKGMLPEGKWNESDDDPRKAELGALRAISAELFEAIWKSISASNR